MHTILLDCYLDAIKNSAHYAVELDDEITGPHREYLTSLAEEVASGDAARIAESRGVLRGLLRVYRDKAGRYLQQMREELAVTARALQDTLDCLAQSDGDHAIRLQKAVTGLRQIAESADCADLRATVRAASESIEVSMDQMRKEHQITVSQFLVEIRMLHKRIEGLEAAASIDAMAGFFNRAQMEEHIRSATAGSYHLLLFQVRGLTRAEAQFGSEVGEELAGAFSKRLKNALPQQVVLGRWSTEEFIAMTGPSKDRVSSQWIAERLSGTYTCMQSGKTVRPGLEVTLGTVESTSHETAATTLERVGTFLTSE